MTIYIFTLFSTSQSLKSKKKCENKLVNNIAMLGLQSTRPSYMQSYKVTFKLNYIHNKINQKTITN